MKNKEPKLIEKEKNLTYDKNFISAMEKDINTPMAISILHKLCKNKGNEKEVLGGCKLLGIL